MMLTLVLVVCCVLIGPISGTSPFTNQHVEERRCPVNIFPGYENCVCDYKTVPAGYQLIWINCTAQGFNEVESLGRLRMLSSMLFNHSYTELEKFVFTGNTIYELPPNIVGRNTLENLALMDLSNNKIHTIKGKTFHSMPSLTELYLDNNDWYVDEGSPRVFSSIFNLEILSLNNAFALNPPNDKSVTHVTRLSTVFEGSSLDYLKELYLENNNLFHVEYQTFQHLISLEVLSLAHNHISNAHGIWNSTCYVSEYVSDYMGLDNRCNLQRLDLSYNSITTIPKSLLDELSKVKDFNTLNLTGNPFFCDCQLLDFYDWLKDDIDNDRYTIPDHQGLTCRQPAELEGRPIISLDRDELKCVQYNTQWDHTNHTASIVLGSLFGLMLLGIVVGVIVNRAVVKEKSTKVWNNAKQYLPAGKVGYKRVEEPLKEPVSV